MKYLYYPDFDNLKLFSIFGSIMVGFTILALILNAVLPEAEMGWAVLGLKILCLPCWFYPLAVIVFRFNNLDLNYVHTLEQLSNRYPEFNSTLLEGRYKEHFELVENISTDPLTEKRFSRVAMQYYRRLRTEITDESLLTP